MDFEFLNVLFDRLDLGHTEDVLMGAIDRANFMVAIIPEAIRPIAHEVAIRKPIPGLSNDTEKPKAPLTRKLIHQILCAYTNAAGLIIHIPPNKNRNALMASVLSLSRRVRRGMCKMPIIAPTNTRSIISPAILFVPVIRLTPVNA